MNAERIAALEARIDHLEQERAIADVIAAYAAYADLGLNAEWVDQFTEDGVFDVAMSRAVDPDATGDDPEPFRLVRFVGHEELRALMDGPIHQGIVGRSAHLMGQTLRIALDGDDAVATSHSVLIMRDEGGSLETRSIALNRWTLRRADGRWRIASVVRRTHGTPGFSDLLLPARPTTS